MRRHRDEIMFNTRGTERDCQARRALAALAIALLLAPGSGCQTRSAVRPWESGLSSAAGRITAPSLPDARALARTPASTVQQASHVERTDIPPPRVRDFDQLKPWPMSFDDAVRIALENSAVIRGSGGRVLAVPRSVHTPLDPALAETNPLLGPQAALSAFDSRLETGLFWNGGGRSVGSPLSAGPFGVFSQPTTLAKVGLGRTFETGTEFTIGGVGGYDSKLATGAYAAVGGSVRHPLLRGAGREFNRIAGPRAEPGSYRGIWIAQIESEKAHLDLEQAVRDLVREVAKTYWELSFAFQNLETKRAAREHARQSWQREQTRVAEQVSPADAEAIARQQFYAADADVQNAISGTGPSPSGVYAVENSLRVLLGLPATDGMLIRPTTQPLESEFAFDWQESLALTQTRRLETRRQLAEVRRRDLELKAARNMTQPQVDFVGQYRRLADDPGNQSALFAEALQGWQIGIDFRRAVGNRREAASARHAQLQLHRAHAVLEEQRRQLASQLRSAFTELDRAFGVTQSLALSRDAAAIRLAAQRQRHAAGETDIETLLQAQIRSTQAATAFQRSLVDYNLALVNVHFVRGTLLETLGVGFAEHGAPDEVLFARNAPTLFAAPAVGAPPVGGEELATERSVDSGPDAARGGTAQRLGRLPPP